MKQHSRLDFLMMAIHRWLELPKVSRSIAAAEIVGAVERLGMVAVLANEGITFNKSSDPYNDSRVNAQKIFRWLGQYQENHAMPERLWFVEPIILAAMPEQLRLQYLNDVYSCCGVTVVSNCNQHDSDEIELTNVAIFLTKEHSEAQIAVMQLNHIESPANIMAAHKELREAAGATTAAIQVLEKEFPILTQ